MQAHLDTAATKALEIILQHRITAAPIMPLPILKSLPGVLVVPYAEMAERMGVERESVITAFGPGNADAVTNYRSGDSRIRYLVTYNQRLPFYLQQRALARELGHIVLGHDGTRPEDIRMDEALTFARHLLCPRPLIRALQEAGIKITAEVLGNTTGCYERCLAGIKKTPGLHVPAELNRAVKAQFADYVKNYLDCQAVLTGYDESPVADFGSFMDCYEE